jgi:molybdate transport system substrate-binding protein
MIQKSFLFFIMISTGLLARDELLFYCGTTMVPAMMDAKVAFEQEHSCTITIIQGGSKDLCKSIETTHHGDLFLPGKSDYIDQCTQDGYVHYTKMIGYNRLAIFFPKGNPKQIKGLDDLLRKDLLTTLGNPNTCSIGKMTEDTLLRYGGNPFLEKAKYNLGIYASDSRDMNRLIQTKQADTGLNWIAASHTTSDIDYLLISDLYASPQELIIATLTFSKHPKLANAFVDYLASSHGQSIMKKHRFFHE